MTTHDTATDAGSRQYYDTFEDALRDFAIPVENHALVRETVAGLEYGRIYVPTKSRPYIALEGSDGAPVVAYVNSGTVDIHRPEGGYDRVELPTNRLGAASGGGAKRHPADLQRDACPACFTELPASGLCGTCD
ncbi:hypothetical protein [Demequina soli]|uniref:hypothetical protein n=1 Tax=Demequina soli TaxID=1638987 RepID=UPI00078119B1|nr:hypothetical protein [Demequina soli]